MYVYLTKIEKHSKINPKQVILFMYTAPMAIAGITKLSNFFQLH